MTKFERRNGHHVPQDNRDMVKTASPQLFGLAQQTLREHGHLATNGEFPVWEMSPTTVKDGLYDSWVTLVASGCDPSETDEIFIRVSAGKSITDFRITGTTTEALTQYATVFDSTLAEVNYLDRLLDQIIYEG